MATQAGFMLYKSILKPKLELLERKGLSLHLDPGIYDTGHQDWRTR